MKKNIFFIFLFFIFPLSVYANTMELDCENYETNKISCEIIGSSSDTITEVSFHISMSDTVSMSSFTADEGWKITTNNDDLILLNSDGLTNTFKIGKIIFETKKEEKGTITIESIEYKNVNNDIISLKNINKNLPLSTNNSLLSNIIIEHYLINFDRDTYSYNIKINDENKLNITAIPENYGTTYEILNNDNLTNGTDIQIITKSKDNLSTTYTLKIIKNTTIEKVNYQYIFIGIVVLIIIINVARLISRRKK